MNNPTVCTAGVLLMGGRQRDLKKHYLPRAQADVPVPETIKQTVSDVSHVIKE